MDDEEERKHAPSELLKDEISSPASSLVMKRRELTAGFDERQMQLFNEALIAVLTADMPEDKLTQVLAEAYNTTLYVYAGQMLADSHLASATASPPAQPRSPERSARPMLLSCTSCHGYSLRMRGKLVQCNDCGAIQPAIIDRPRIVQQGEVIQELAARFFATGEDATAAMREEEERELEKKKAGDSNLPAKSEADVLACGDIAGKEIVKVTLSGTNLVLMFHDGTVQ